MSVCVQQYIALPYIQDTRSSFSVLCYTRYKCVPDNLYNCILYSCVVRFYNLQKITHAIAVRTCSKFSTMLGETASFQLAQANAHGLSLLTIDTICCKGAMCYFIIKCFLVVYNIFNTACCVYVCVQNPLTGNTISSTTT